MEQVTEAALYEVFINHRGPDVKRTLASLIYSALGNCGMTAFLDSEEIRTGDTLTPAITAAINSASVHVAIFSARYAESSWCLNELDSILKVSDEHNTKIIPVFWDVKPSDLRYIESGCYAYAFKNHKQKRRVDLEDLEKWKTALGKASHISGLEVKTNESDYGKIVNKIVEMVNEEIFKRVALKVAKFPVGLDLAAKDFENKYQKSSHSNATTIVVIAGIPGVGKSTLAKHLYNLRRPHFKRSSILSEVRSQPELRYLQEQLLHDLLHSQSLPRISSISQGKEILQIRLPRLSRVLLVLDDVDNIAQIESLLDVESVPSGSLILITSCDQDLLRHSSVKTEVHVLKPLDKNYARELFCLHAFSQSEPPEELKDLVEEFLNVCGGLPLSLKVLGGLFVGCRDKVYWERQLDRFSTTLPNSITNTLKISYEALDPKEKEVFLDIGCFLVGEAEELAIHVLEGLYEDNTIGECLQSLQKKCLVGFCDRTRKMPRVDGIRKYYIECDDTCKSITMHDQLREFARHIAREEFRVFPTRNPLRLSSPSDIHEVCLHWQAGSTFQVRGVRLSTPSSYFGRERDIGATILPPTGHSDIAVKVEGLRLFVVDNEAAHWAAYWAPISTSNLWGELVWLRLHCDSKCFYKCSISLRRLRVLEIQSTGSSVEGFFDHHHNELPRDINELNIVYTDPIDLTGSPANLSNKAFQGSVLAFQTGSVFRYIEKCVTGMITLTRLVLKNLGLLQLLPIDFSHLQSLRHLDLSGCCQLTELPNTFSGLLQLKYLVLQNCSNLTIPIDILGEISTLEYVDFEGCVKLSILPERIPYQRNLRYLNLLGTGLLRLPYNLGGLDNLKKLGIGSPALIEIPRTVANLRGLTELFLFNCPGLQRILAEGIAAPNISFLAIDRCPIDNFSSQDQGNLNVGSGMSSLIDLILTNTSISQMSIPDCVSPSLETIDLSDNSRLMRVNALPSALVSLNLQNCRGLKTLTGLSNLVNLKFLNMNGCSNLETLNMEGLASLKEIKADECWELQRIEGLNHLDCLHISTDNTVIWDDICQFLRSPIHEEGPSTAIFSGRGNNNKMFDEGDIPRIAQKFNLQICGFVSGIAEFCSKQFLSHGAALVCVITDNVKSHKLTVDFGPVDCGPLSYSITTGNRGGRGVHVFLFTEGSPLFKEDKNVFIFDRRIVRYYFKVCTVEGSSNKASSRAVRSIQQGAYCLSNKASSRAVGSFRRVINAIPQDAYCLSYVQEKNVEVAWLEKNVEGAWLVMGDKKTDVLEACREIIMGYA